MLRSLNAFLIKAALIAALTLPLTAQAQTTPKIGLIDLKRVFDNYYKTKQADAQLKERATDSEKVLKGMRDDYQKTGEEYRKLVESANDQAVSAEEREKRKKSAESKMTELQELEKNAQTFQRQTQTTLDEQRRRLRDNILKEIRELVNAKAKTASYTLIMDTAAESVNQTPIILFTNNQNDITEEVLTEMNAKAPPGALSTTEAPKEADKPEKKK
jgi:outer membrane protein